MSKISIPGAIICGVALVAGVTLAIWGGEYSGHAEGLIGIAIGLLTRIGAIGRGTAVVEEPSE